VVPAEKSQNKVRLLLNVDKEFDTLCLDYEIAKEEEEVNNPCNNCHCHINSRSNYLICYGTDDV
jgi:hypothetical protein